MIKYFFVALLFELKGKHYQHAKKEFALHEFFLAKINLPHFLASLVYLLFLKGLSSNSFTSLYA